MTIVILIYINYPIGIPVRSLTDGGTRAALCGRAERREWIERDYDEPCAPKIPAIGHDRGGAASAIALRAGGVRHG
jgi:hypothetical protein